VGPIFEEYATGPGRPAIGSTFKGGDFFADPLPSADVVMMGHVLHDWDLAQKSSWFARRTTRCRRAAPSSFIEAIIDDDRSRNAFGLMMSLNMLIETEGGFDYPGAECIGW
jgi:hypothetical protein